MRPARRFRFRRGGSALAVVALLFAATGAPAGVPVPWVPANAGVLWYQPNDADYPLSLPRQPPGEPGGAWWLTRRIVADPHRQGILHLGSFLHGLYVTAGGGGWATLTPGCWLPVEPPKTVPADAGDGYRYARRAAIAATGLDGCAIEGLAYDPVVSTRMYAAAYDVVRLRGTEPTLGDAGVYVSDTLGASWRRLAGGFRGNGLAVHRASATRPATIVVGFIQASNASVGPTPGNGSLLLSADDGRSWRTVALPASGCPDVPESSQRITPTLLINPARPNIIYAGTNAGLYLSLDGGTNWSPAKVACGGAWGIAVSDDGETLYVGDKDGVVWKGHADATSLRQIADLGSGKVQSLVLDRRDERFVYAAVWAGGDASVFRIGANGGQVGRLDESLLRDVVPADRAWPSSAPKPFPISFRDAAGASAPSLFLADDALAPDPISAPLWVSTIFRGVFVRGD